MAIKKQFQEVWDFLVENKDKKVSTVLDSVEALVQTKSRGGSANTSYRDEEGNVVAIFDYYFKQWMPLSHIEFGAKASSNTGYNSMCKEGVSNWTRQQNAARKAEAKLLEDAIAGEVTQDQMASIKEEIEAERTAVIPHSTGIGFETIEELLEADTAELDRLVEEAAANEAEDETAEDQAEAA